MVTHPSERMMVRAEPYSSEKKGVPCARGMEQRRREETVEGGGRGLALIKCGRWNRRYGTTCQHGYIFCQGQQQSEFVTAPSEYFGLLKLCRVLL